MYEYYQPSLQSLCMLVRYLLGEISYWSERAQVQKVPGKSSYS